MQVLTTNQHVETPLRDYVRSAVPKVEPDIRPKYHREMIRAVDAFLAWLNEEIVMADVTVEMVSDYLAATSDERGARFVRSVMRKFDPFTFRARNTSPHGRPLQLEQGDGSEYLLANVYLKRYEPMALRTRRPNTKRLYKTTLLMFDRFLGRSATLDDLNNVTVSAFAAWRAERVSKLSVNKDLFNLLALWRWCHRRGLVEEWPEIQMEQPERRTPVAWTAEELRRLYVTMTNLPGRVGSVRARQWWPALLLVLWNSGERINAVMKLRWHDVDMVRGWVRFRAEHRKGGRDDSLVNLGADTLDALRKLPKEGELVFSWPQHPTYLWNELGRILRLAGLPDDARSKFHKIRRSVASYAEAAGANATAMLRHSKREITETYLDPTIVRPQQPVDVLFRLSEGGAA